MLETSVSLLLDHVQQNKEGTDTPMDTLIQSLTETEELTKNEQRMLFIHLSNKTSNSYNIPLQVQFPKSIDIWTNLALVLDSLPIFSTRFANGKATNDARVTIKDMNDDDIDLMAPFDLESGPLCRFAVDSEKNVLKGCIHHSICDGRSMDILLEAVVTGQVKASSKEFNVRKYAALEASEEMTCRYAESVEEWKRMMGDTPARLEVDFGSTSPTPAATTTTHPPEHTSYNVDQSGKDTQASLLSSPYTSHVTLDGDTLTGMQSFCKEKGISMFSLALSTLHQSMRAYSHEAFAVGVAHDVRPREFQDTVGMFVNTVLVPFKGGEGGGCESVRDLHHRWTNDILPHAKTPYDMVSSLGYGCNVYLAYNVGVVDMEQGGKGGDEDNFMGSAAASALYHHDVVDINDSDDVVLLNMDKVST